MHLRLELNLGKLSVANHVKGPYREIGSDCRNQRRKGRSFDQGIGKVQRRRIETQGFFHSPVKGPDYSGQTTTIRPLGFWRDLDREVLDGGFILPPLLSIHVL